MKRRFLSFVEVFLFFISATVVIVSASQPEEDIGRLKNGGSSPTTPGKNASSTPHNIPTRGIMMCAANKMIPDVIKMIRQTRDLWGSKLSYAVSHCGEISQDKKQVVLRVEKNVQFVDLCGSTNKLVFGMDPHYAKRRLRGFFCKVGALIASPFEQTLVADLDVVWMQSPDRLFESKYFQQTGSLFFRDRVYHFRKKDHSKIRINVEDIIPFFEQQGVSVTKESANRMAIENGVSLFWLHIAGRLNNSKANSSEATLKQITEGEVDSRYPFLSEYQDSSVVMVDSAKHPKLLKVLEQQLPSFGFGYGDKELFWVAATISGEPFAFEPFLSGQYGDCYGVVLHYDPDDADLPNSELAKPLYLNAEYFIEKELTCVGEFVRTRMTIPRLAANHHSSSTPILLDSRTYERPQDVAEAQNYSCTCDRLGCMEFPQVMNRYLLYVQWLTLSASLSSAASLHQQKGGGRSMVSSGDEHWPCIPISVAHHTAINELFLYNITATSTTTTIAGAHHGGGDHSSSSSSSSSSAASAATAAAAAAAAAVVTTNASSSTRQQRRRLLSKIIPSTTGGDPRTTPTTTISSIPAATTTATTNIIGNRGGHSNRGHSHNHSKHHHHGEDLCYRMGCPHLPIELNMSMPWIPQKARYCEPVLFRPLADTLLDNEQQQQQQQRRRSDESTSVAVPPTTTTTTSSSSTFSSSSSSSSNAAAAAAVSLAAGGPDLLLTSSAPGVNSTTTTRAPVATNSTSTTSTSTGNSISGTRRRQDFEAAVIEARSPHSKWNRPSYPDKTVFHLAGTNRFYLYQENQTHLIPNLATFLKLGLEFPSAIVMPAYKLLNLPAGAEMPPM